VEPDGLTRGLAILGAATGTLSLLVSAWTARWAVKANKERFRRDVGVDVSEATLALVARVRNRGGRDEYVTRLSFAAEYGERYLEVDSAGPNLPKLLPPGAADGWTVYGEEILQVLDRLDRPDRFVVAVELGDGEWVRSVPLHWGGSEVFSG
jgi:hypothetical protein